MENFTWPDVVTAWLLYKQT